MPFKSVIIPYRSLTFSISHLLSPPRGKLPLAHATDKKKKECCEFLAACITNPTKTTSCIQLLAGVGDLKHKDGVHAELQPFGFVLYLALEILLVQKECRTSHSK